MDAAATTEDEAPVRVITLPCEECGAEIVLPPEEASALECPACGALRRVRWFSGPQMWTRWRNWVLFERPRLKKAGAR